MAIRVFPVDATAHPQFADAFGSHRGTDIFAPAGSPVLAVDDGEARSDIDPKGGQVIYLKASDGTVYYFAHLQDYNGSFPRAVQMGETIGTVGTTGDAQGKDPHLHFEVHPNGDSVSVDPYPLLLDVAPHGSLQLPVPVMPLPPSPLPPLPVKKKPPVQELPGLWFWSWGRLLALRTSGRVGAGDVLSGEA
jgi:murein DD-endopeptidase MepM/ murein hydrolase activator NlpD